MANPTCSAADIGIETVSLGYAVKVERLADATLL
jgi:hypothetical protein